MRVRFNHTFVELAVLALSIILFLAALIVAASLAPAAAEANGGHPGIIYPPPKQGDNSCWARALRLFPWASQSERRSIWFEACQATESRPNSAKKQLPVIREPESRNDNCARTPIIICPSGDSEDSRCNLPGHKLVCILNSTDGTTTMVCKFATEED
jgi:hypothetical protein